MFNILFLIFITAISVISTWYLYNNNFKKNIWKKVDFLIEGNIDEVLTNMKKYSKSHGWIIEKSLNDYYFEYRIPLSAFFWGGKVLIEIKPSIDDFILLSIKSKPSFIKSQIQNSILEKEISDLLPRISSGKILIPS